MARLLRTESLGVSVNRQHLYDLIHTSSLTDVGVTVVGVSSIVASTNNPGFTSSVWWFDQDLQLLRVPIVAVGGSPCSLWLAVGPDCLETPVYNATANVYPRGSVVSYATSGIYDVELTVPRITTNTSYGLLVAELRQNSNMRSLAGVLQATLSQGQWGCAAVRGVCYTRNRTVAASASANTALKMVMSTTYTGCVDWSSSFNCNPLHIGYVMCRASISYTAGVCLPSMLWLPWGSHTGDPIYCTGTTS